MENGAHWGDDDEPRLAPLQIPEVYKNYFSFTSTKTLETLWDALQVIDKQFETQTKKISSKKHKIKLCVLDSKDEEVEFSIEIFKKSNEEYIVDCIPINVDRITFTE